ncbi:MAG: UDP-2,3-diacylglucosamine diphosphatase [Gammaproteobacteria bacterium]|nr:MAG: UDP-2,3-diacylglucosamine diphosphatase [Gammaproteobacteria bacterium]
MATYFIGDLHLSPPSASAGSPDPVIAQFEQFCSACATDADALYILGDLFEVWIGDDAGLGPYHTVIDTLNNLTFPVFVLHGNRDFLLDKAFCKASDAQRLADPAPITCAGQKILLSHGDQLCTDDVDYQRGRALFMQAEWRSNFLSQSIELRAQQAAALRDQSASASSKKSVEIMDVNDDAVVTLLEQSQLLTLVHGHTHRPGRHEHATQQGQATRWVVGSWQEDAEILRWDDSGPQLIKLADYLKQ